MPRPATRGVATPQTLRGMKDILPSEQKYWLHVRDAAEPLAAAYGYDRIDTPILEETGLFVRSVGKQTDIVEKEMFSFIDAGGENVSLRPEATASIVRSYINHGMFNQPQPVKLFYWGPMFRHERPQSGRFREFHQFGFEVLGDKHPVLDAEIILIAHLFFKELGIKTAVQINSLGCPTCRPTYLAELTNYYRAKRSQLCENCKRRLLKNPLRVLDCKEAGCAALKDGAPQIVDSLCEECKNHFMRVLEYLDEIQVPYVLNPHLVRGLDYYTKTVFEIWPADETESSQSALGGGGRYDGLVEVLGGRPTPACGFAIGIERAILQLKSANIEPSVRNKPDIFMAQLGDVARRKVVPLFEELRKAGINVASSFSKDSLKSQLEIANRLGSRYTLIIGQKEVLDGTVLIRDMEAGMQEIVDYNRAVGEMKKKLGRP
ncbi:histidine--tRNA ligase [Candidatus Uhrbacteria bacterium]|nr:histidine--tRNA ligase [Candidatus Uhrbacteria bacterium]